MLKKFSGNSISKYLKRFRSRLTEQGGFGLMEVIISLMIFGTAAFMLVSSLSSGMLFVRRYQDRVMAENTARTQMALIRSPLQEYIAGADSYTPLTDSGEYDVTITVTEIDPILTNSMQMITVKVYRASILLYTLEGVKANP